MKPVACGDRGPAVVDIQVRLANLGYLPGGASIDGCYGRDTESAVKSFQQDCGVHPTGAVDQRTWWEIVERSYTLGDRLLYLRWPFLRGSDVKHLQELLVKLGFRVGPVDGIFGPATDKAVRELQRNLLLPLDGIVGQNTLGALKNLRNILNVHPRSLMPWSLTTRQEKLAFLSGKDVLLTYCRSDEKALHKSRKNLTAQLAALLRLTGARVRVKSWADVGEVEADLDAVETGKAPSMLFGIGYTFPAASLSDIGLVHPADDEALSALCTRIAGILQKIAGKSIKVEQLADSAVPTGGVFLAMSGGEADLLSDESLRQRIAVAVVDSLGRSAAEVEADKQANSKDASLRLDEAPESEVPDPGGLKPGSGPVELTTI